MPASSGPERVGDARLEPADHPGAPAAEQHAALPRLAQDRVEPVDAPDRERVRRVPARDVDRVLREHELAQLVGRPRAERDVARLGAPRERLVEREQRSSPATSPPSARTGPAARLRARARDRRSACRAPSRPSRGSARPRSEYRSAPERRAVSRSPSRSRRSASSTCVRRGCAATQPLAGRLSGGYAAAVGHRDRERRANIATSCASSFCEPARSLARLADGRADARRALDQRVERLGRQLDRERRRLRRRASPRESSPSRTVERDRLASLEADLVDAVDGALGPEPRVDGVHAPAVAGARRAERRRAPLRERAEHARAARGRARSARRRSPPSGGGSFVFATIPAPRGRGAATVRMFEPIPGSASARSVNRRWPSISSRTMRSAQRSPIWSSAWATGQYWP